MTQRNRRLKQFTSLCLSRRVLLRAGVAGSVAALATAMPSRYGRGEAKLPQNQVSYQSSPKNGKHCQACVNYEGNNSCRVVAGEISPDGWCRLWNAR